ncbi:type VI secretion protein TagU [Pseudomonas gessardii]|nr:type VI secretion protein TagU [Pseudomonas gessardii]MBH3422531.1 type VI secretion protein TagU [Pseudomonas gessardii]
MSVFRWPAVGMVLLMWALSGCTANYVFDDDDYRPLGDPRSNQRGQ